MTNVTLKNGKQATLTVDTKNQTAFVAVDGMQHLVAYMRGNVVKIKNDMLLNGADMASVKAQMAQFIKKSDADTKKRK